MYVLRIQNELYSAVWKLFSQSSTDVPGKPRQIDINSLQNLLNSSFCFSVHWKLVIVTVFLSRNCHYNRLSPYQMLLIGVLPLQVTNVKPQ